MNLSHFDYISELSNRPFIKPYCGSTYIKRCNLFNLLYAIKVPITSQITTYTDLSINKTVLEKVNWHKLSRLNRNRYLLNFDKYSVLRKKIGPNCFEGSSWQRHIPKSPLTTHYETGKPYLRVLPLEEPTYDYFADDQFVEEWIIKQFIPPDNRLLMPIIFYCYKLESIMSIEIAGITYYVIDDDIE